MDIRRKANVIFVVGRQQKQDEVIITKKNFNAHLDDVPPPPVNDEILSNKNFYSNSSDFTSDSEEDNKSSSNNNLIKKNAKETLASASASASVPSSPEFDLLMSSLARPEHYSHAVPFIQITSASRNECLDRDWYDKSRELVILWRLLRPRQINQLWRFDFINNNNSSSSSSFSSFLPQQELTSDTQQQIPAIETRISCLLPSLSQKTASKTPKQEGERFEIGYLRFCGVSNTDGNRQAANSGIKVVAPSSLTQEEIKNIEPTTRWFVVPIPGSLKVFEERVSSKNSQSMKIKSVEVLLLAQSQKNPGQFFALRANDLNEDDNGDDNDDNDREQVSQQQETNNNKNKHSNNNSKHDMAKSELEMVPFKLLSSIGSSSSCDRWVVRI